MTTTNKQVFSNYLNFHSWCPLAPKTSFGPAAAKHLCPKFDNTSPGVGRTQLTTKRQPTVSVQVSWSHDGKWTVHQDAYLEVYTLL